MSNGLIFFILTAFAAGGSGGRWHAWCRFGSSVPRYQRQLLVLVRVFDGGLQVNGDGVISSDGVIAHEKPSRIPGVLDLCIERRTEFKK
jgi:hypothetical protein